LQHQIYNNQLTGCTKENKKMIKLKLFFTILLLAGLVPVLADNITVDGVQRNYIVYAPNNLGTNRPLLISCHGSNQDANYQKNTQMKMETVADTAKLLIVFPNGIDRQWDISGDRDIRFITALIDEMAAKYGIDRNRVYLSGFSMGGMLTYHAMNKIADKIAAFAPISGYPLWGAAANSSRPVPILHTQGTADDVVTAGGIQGVLDKWIQRNRCSTVPKTYKQYKGYGHVNLYVWGDGEEGVEVRLLEMVGKGHWVSNDGVITGEEIWNFCKNYSLDKTSPSVSFVSPKAGAGYISFAPQGEAAFPPVALEVRADDANGSIVRVDFYDGGVLVGTVSEAPYTLTLTGLKAGKHTLKAVATDNDGETGTAVTELNLQAPASLNLSQAFSEAGCVPAGWAVYDSKEKRTGYSSGYGQGCRILQLTGSQRDFDYGLYIRNIEGSARAGWAKYGLAETGTALTLAPGRYVLDYRICNWNCPSFAPVEIRIEKSAGGQAVASKSFTPAVNIGNAVSNSFSGVETQTFEFAITESDSYVLAFYTADGQWTDCIIGALQLSAREYGTVGISTATAEQGSGICYNLQGIAVERPTKGMYLRNGKKIIIK
jgi:poly(3-hydroxybutyrate) depolymerase